MRPFTLIILFISFISFISCNSKIENKLEEGEATRNFKKLYTLVKKQMGLKQNSNDTIIRLWQHGPFTSFQLNQFVFDSLNSNVCTFNIYSKYSYTEYGFDPFRKNVDSVKVNCTHNIPKNILGELKENGLDTLKSQDQYNGFESQIDDGVRFSIEIVSKHNNKFISYHCPSYFAKNQDQTFLKLLSVLEKHVYIIRMDNCSK